MTIKDKGPGFLTPHKASASKGLQRPKSNALNIYCPSSLKASWGASHFIGRASMSLPLTEKEIEILNHLLLQIPMEVNILNNHQKSYISWPWFIFLFGIHIQRHRVWRWWWWWRRWWWWWRQPQLAVPSGSYVFTCMISSNIHENSITFPHFADEKIKCHKGWGTRPSSQSLEGTTIRA